MPANPFFSGRIPQQLHDAVERRCGQTGESKTQILIAALSQYLGLEIPATGKAFSTSTDSPHPSENLEQRIATLENLLSEKFSELEQRLGELEPEPHRRKLDPALSGQMSILDIQPDSDDKTDNSDNNVEVGNSKALIVGTSDAIKLARVPRQTLDDWHKKGRLPQIRNGFLITFSHMQEKPTKKAFWRLEKTDNSDNQDT